MDKKFLESVFGAPLSVQGFKKKASTWYRQLEGILQVVNLQKSSWGMQFYVNLCFVPAGMEIEGMPTPKQHKCPIWIRLEAAFPEQKEEIEKVFELEASTISEQDKAEEVVRLVNELVLPFMARMKDTFSLREAVEGGRFKNAWVNLAAQKHLGIQQ